MLSIVERVAEAAIGFLGILLVAPLMVAITLGIVLTAGRPALTLDPWVSARRTGRPLLTFRTDTTGFPRLGITLRESGLDKLPRLVNLLDGNCDFVDLLS